MTNKLTAFNLKGAFFERRGEREGCWYKLRECPGKICPQMFPLMIAVSALIRIQTAIVVQKTCPLFYFVGELCWTFWVDSYFDTNWK